MAIFKKKLPGRGGGLSTYNMYIFFFFYSIHKGTDMMTGPLPTNIYLNLLCYVYLKIKEIIHYLITIPLYMYIFIKCTRPILSNRKKNKNSPCSTHLYVSMLWLSNKSIADVSYPLKHRSQRMGRQSQDLLHYKN